VSKYRANFIKNNDQSNVFETHSSFQGCIVTVSHSSVKCQGNLHPDGVGGHILMAEEKLEGTSAPRSNWMR